MPARSRRPVTRTAAAKAHRQRRLAPIYESERELLWLLPTLAAVLTAVVGAGLARLGPTSTTSPLLLDTDAGGYRSVLIGILTALLTALSVVLSVTLVAIQTAGTNYSPRLLRNFLRDRKTQTTLAYLLGSLGFTLGLLLGSQPQAPPVLGTTVALVGVLGAAVAIVVFISHIAGSLRVEHLLDEVVAECGHTIDRVLANAVPAGGDDVRADLPRPPPGALVVPADETGYLLAVDTEVLCRLARDGGLVVRLVVARGEQVVDSAPVAWIWSADAGPDRAFPAGPPDLEKVVASIRQAMVVGFERTLQQDISFGIRQIVDLAIKAMSPAVNDPYSAVQSLDHLERLFVRLAPWRLGHQLLHEDSGRLLAAVPSSGFADHLRLATDQIIRYGAREPAVLARVLRLLRTVAGATPGLHREVLHERVSAVLSAARARELWPADALHELEQLAGEVERWIGGDLAPVVEQGPSLL